MCKLHHSRWYATGRTGVINTPAYAPLRWLEQVVNSPLPSTCIEWPFGKQTHGYGMLTLGNRKRRLAHRASYEMHNGVTLEPTIYVLHACDNPACVNPAHLSAGTQLQNGRDAVERGRLARGERSKLSKLTEAQVVLIRTDPRPSPAVAAIVGVSASQVRRIRRGVDWKHSLRSE